MNQFSFAEYLKKLPHEALFRSFLKKSTAGRKVLSSSTISTVVEQASEPEAVCKRFDALSQAGRELCSFAYLFGDQGLSASDARLQRTQLLGSYLVYEARDEAGNRFLIGFEEFVAPLRERIILSLRARLAEEPDNPKPLRLSYRDCLNDLVALLSLAAEGGLKKTQGGSLSKPALQNLHKITHTRNAALSGDTLFPWLLAEYAIDRRLVILADSGYRSLAGPVSDWMEQSLTARRDDFLHRSILRLGRWRTDLLSALLDNSAPQWLSDTLFPPQHREEARRVFRTLAYCAAALINRHETSLFIAPIPEQQPAVSNGSVSLLPDFSAIIAQEVDPDELYRFSLLGRIVSFDKVYKGQVERGVLFNSLSRGISPRLMQEALVSWNSPANVRMTVNEWTREFFRVSVTTETILISAEESISNQITSFEGLREYVHPIEAHRVFRIKAGSEQHVRTLLSSLGFDPRVPELAVSPLESTPQPQPRRSPITDLSTEETAPADFRQKTGKYSSELKALDFSETLHVIDYSILMGYRLRFSYAGSPLIRRGEYTVRPIAWRKSKDDPVLEGETIETGNRKQFIISRIERIGVEPDEADV